MILTDKQAYILLQILQDSLRAPGLLFSVPIDERALIMQEIINQQSNKPVQLKKEE